MVNQTNQTKATKATKAKKALSANDFNYELTKQCAIDGGMVPYLFVFAQVAQHFDIDHKFNFAALTLQECLSLSLAGLVVASIAPFSLLGMLLGTLYSMFQWVAN